MEEIKLTQKYLNQLYTIFLKHGIFDASCHELKTTAHILSFRIEFLAYAMHQHGGACYMQKVIHSGSNIGSHIVLNENCKNIDEKKKSLLEEMTAVFENKAHI